MKLTSLLSMAIVVLTSAVSAQAAEITLSVTSFPPGKTPGPGVAAAIIRAEGTENHEIAWHWQLSPEDELFDAGLIFAGRPNVIWWFSSSRSGPRTVKLQIATPGLDPFAECTFDYGEPAPDEKNPYPPPGQTWRDRVAQLASHKLSRQDATNLAKVYAESSKAVRTGSVASVQDLADDLANRASGLGLKGKYAGLADTMQSVYEEIFGKRERPLDAPRTEEALLAIAWQVWETGK